MSQSSPWCHVMGGISVPPRWFRQRPISKYRNYGKESSLGYEFRSAGVEDIEAVESLPFVALFPCLLFSSLHLFFGCWHGTTGFSTASKSLPLEMEFQHASYLPKDRNWSVPLDWVTCGCLQLCILHSAINTHLHSDSNLSPMLAYTSQEVST